MKELLEQLKSELQILKTSIGIANNIQGRTILCGQYAQLKDIIKRIERKLYPN